MKSRKQQITETTFNPFRLSGNQQNLTAWPCYQPTLYTARPVTPPTVMSQWIVMERRPIGMSPVGGWVGVREWGGVGSTPQLITGVDSTLPHPHTPLTCSDGVGVVGVRAGAVAEEAVGGVPVCVCVY
jgi:hypothetical protein